MSAMQISVTALSAFAAEVRPDWDHGEIAGAVVAASRADWPWTRILSEVTRMIADDDAAPRDLLVAARSPLERGKPPSAGTYERGAALAREALMAVTGAPVEPDSMEVPSEVA